MANVDTDRLLTTIQGGKGIEHEAGEAAEVETARATPLTKQPAADISGAAAISSSMKAQVDQVTNFTLGAIEEAEERLKELREETLSDATRLKSELDANVISAEAIVRQARGVVTLIEDIRAKRTSAAHGG